MFDLPACHRPFTQFPLFSNWGQLEWVKLILIAAFLGLIILLLRWVQHHSVWQRSNWINRLIGLAGIVAAIVLLPVVAEQGLTGFLPADAGEPVDAIVVLGRGIELGVPRIETVTNLWNAKRAPTVFVSGTGDTPRMLPLLEAKGIPQTALDGENCSQTTPENALFSAAILQARGVQKILLITDAPHLWRSLLDFQAQHFTVIPYASPMPNSIRGLDRTFLIFRECFFLITSTAREWLVRDRFPEAKTPELQSLVEQAQAYGKQHS